MNVPALLRQISLIALCGGALLLLCPKRMAPHLRWCLTLCVLYALMTPLLQWSKQTPVDALPAPAVTAELSAARWMAQSMLQGFPSLEGVRVADVSAQDKDAALLLVQPTLPTGAQEQAARQLADTLQTLYGYTRVVVTWQSQ